MARKTIERWVAEVFPNERTIRKAGEKDRKIDKSKGAQIKTATDKSPETDWRRMVKRPTNNH